MAAEKAKPLKELYTYDAPWQTYALDWSNRAEGGKLFRLAVGSFRMEYNNKVNVRARILRDNNFHRLHRASLYSVRVAVCF